MNAFLRQSMEQHNRRIELKKEFAGQNLRAASVASAMRIPRRAPDFLQSYEQRCLILLAPLFEAAWADGSIKTKEMEAIFNAAEAYGLNENSEAFARLINSVMSRALPAETEENWRRFQELWRFLSGGERETLGSSLMTQARFVAEQSSNNVMNYLRGEHLSESEEDVLRKISGEIEKANLNAEQNEPRIDDGENFGGKPKTEEIAELLPIVPLVKVAWAEGRITKREREIILEAAEKMGIAPDSLSYQRLSDWLELHPTDDFYTESLELLRDELQKMPEEERALRHLDLLSDCVNIAEASGGTSRYRAGGPRVCDEEIAAVKRIARKINARAVV